MLAMKGIIFLAWCKLTRNMNFNIEIHILPYVRGIDWGTCYQWKASYSLLGASWLEKWVVGCYSFRCKIDYEFKNWVMWV